MLLLFSVFKLLHLGTSVTGHKENSLILIKEASSALQVQYKRVRANTCEVVVGNAEHNRGAVFDYGIPNLCQPKV